MSPASGSKSRDQKAAGKEPQKTSLKPPTSSNTGGGIPTSGYNPLLGTFHTLETAPASSAPPLLANGRFRNIEETDDHSGGAVEYDSVSNNGSWSGESEDHKDKISNPPSRQETVPGADSDKREKIRQKNEKKHQRQKERRAQELHERCSGYLMSRKLEALAQQLVAMGFSSERATMALILNEGRVEESVAWLFEEGEEADNHAEHNLGGGNLKIDISEELARIADLEIWFKCSKQEVERAIVACEGDLEQAAETLRVQKQDPPSVQPKPEETGDPPTLVGNSKMSVAVSQNLLRVQQSKPTSVAGSTQQKRDEKDFNYTKVAVTLGTSAESGNKSMQLLRKIQPKLEWAKQQQVVAVPPAPEKRWPTAGSNPSVSFSLASPLQGPPPPAKTEARYVAVGNELKNLQLGSVREPVVVMQRPQSKQMHTNSASPSSPPTADWHPNGGVEPAMKPNGLTTCLPTSTRSFAPPSFGGSSSANSQLYDQFHYHQQQQQRQQQQQHYLSSSGPVDLGQPGGINQGNGLWSRMVGTSQTLAAASSLGLFSGLGSNGGGPSGPSSPVDWNAGGSMLHLGYANIDWSLDRSPSSSRPSGMWHGMGASSMQSDPNFYPSGRSVKTAMRPVMSNGGDNGVSIAGLHDGVAASETSAGGSREWTSPFEEKDLFSLPRQFVSSPSR